VLWECWPAVRATELLDDPEFVARLDADGMYRLTLAATGDKEKSRQAMSRHAKAMMDSGQKP